MARLYVLIRSNIHKNYQAVQAGHAVAQFVLDYPNDWKNETLIYLKGGEEWELYNWLERFCKLGANYSPFYEPDLDNEMTALAVLSNPEIEGLLAKMKLI